MSIYIYTRHLASTVTVPVTYKCPHCQNTVHDEYDCTVSSPDNKNAKKKNNEKLTMQLLLMSKNTNPESYRQLKLDACCPHCNELQPWSKRSSAVLNKVCLISGVISLFFLAGFSRAPLSPAMLLSIIPFLVFAVSCAIEIRWILQFDKALKNMKPEDFPVFHIEEVLKEER